MAAQAQRKEALSNDDGSYKDSRLQYRTIHGDFNAGEFKTPANDNRTNPDTDEQSAYTNTVDPSQPYVPAAKVRKFRSDTAKVQATGVRKKEIVAKIRATRTSWLILYACGPFYIAQLVFTVLSLVSFGLAADVISAGDLIGGGLMGIAVDTLSFFADDFGEDLFVICWMLASAIGVGQLLIAFGMYLLSGVNLFKQSAVVALGIVMALYFMPFLGFVPWGIFWMWCVVREAGRK